MSPTKTIKSSVAWSDDGDPHGAQGYRADPAADCPAPGGGNHRSLTTMWMLYVIMTAVINLHFMSLKMSMLMVWMPLSQRQLLQGTDSHFSKSHFEKDFLPSAQVTVVKVVTSNHI